MRVKTKKMLKAGAVFGLPVLLFLTGCTSVTVASIPSGAEVYHKESNQRIGRTPATVHLFLRSKEVVVRKDGYFPKTVRLTNIDPAIRHFELARRKKTLLTSRPSGAELYVNGREKKVGTTPFLVDYSKPYRTFELRFFGYYSQHVTIDPSSKSPVSVQLKRKPIVRIQSEPEGALVMHGDEELGKTPYHHFVKKGLELEISADHHYAKRIMVNLDSPRQIDIKLDPMPYIIVKSSPAGAELYRSGGVELIGKTPVEILVEKDTFLELHKTGYSVKPFTLSANSSREVTVPLGKSAAESGKTVLIDSKPSGAEVYRPGGAELIGTTPLKQHVRYERTFELQLDGYKTKIVTVAQDSADTIVFALAKDESVRSIAIRDPLLNTPSSF